jgi:hypothetical protein
MCTGLQGYHGGIGSKGTYFQQGGHGVYNKDSVNKVGFT